VTAGRSSRGPPTPGQNFTRAYGITYSDRENVLQHPFQTSWGLSTRIIGGLIMAHGDDAGLVMPRGWPHPGRGRTGHPEQ